MAKDVMETVKKKLKDGWIKAWMAVEVLALTEEAAESSLKKHIDILEKEDSCIIYKKDFSKTDKVPNPFKDPKYAYSKVVEVEFVAKRFENLVWIVLNYAPSSIEILEPKNIRLELGEAQGVLNSLSELIHNFAISSRGAVMIDT